MLTCALYFFNAKKDDPGQLESHGTVLTRPKMWVLARLILRWTHRHTLTDDAIYLPIFLPPIRYQSYNKY